MPTLPRLCLVRFADYKQKDWDVNAIAGLSILRLAQGSSRKLKVTVMLLYRFLYSSRTTPGLIFVFRYAKR